jgi:hypothetical protein
VADAHLAGSGCGQVDVLELQDFGATGGVLRNPRPAKAAEASEAAGNSYSLHSVGVGIRFGLGSRTTGQLTLSAPVGSNPGRVKGLDSDGRSPAARLWFTGSSRF